MQYKKLVIGTGGNDLVVEVCTETEQEKRKPWHHLSRAGMVGAAKTLEQMAPVLIGIVQLIAEWLL